MEWLSFLTIASSVVSLLALLVLHVVSPEFQPSWRMISEYALGKYKWLITTFFVLWGVSSLLLSILLWPVVTSNLALLGVGLLLVSGLGEIMGGLFDIKHKWHGWAFLLGVPTLPVAALLISYNLVQQADWFGFKAPLLLSAHATWVSLVLMGAAMMIMFSGFKKAGIPMDQEATPPDKVPDGVIALGGYANRFLVVCYIGWLVIVAGILP